jgi:hypothetical protein
MISKHSANLATDRRTEEIFVDSAQIFSTLILEYNGAAKNILHHLALAHMGDLSGDGPADQVRLLVFRVARLQRIKDCVRGVSSDGSCTKVIPDR